MKEHCFLCQRSSLTLAERVSTAEKVTTSARIFKVHTQFHFSKELSMTYVQKFRSVWLPNREGIKDVGLKKQNATWATVLSLLELITTFQ